LRLSRLESDTDIKPFDCGDTDLNGFLFDDAKDYLNSLLAVTYLLTDEENTIAYFSYQNDKISHQDLGNRDKFLQRIGSLLPKGKENHSSYPAVKIGRLGINRNNQRQGLGKRVIDFTKIYFTKKNKTGCKFITVDAYKDSVPFYEKMGFKCLTSRDLKSDTRLMYFNLEIIN